MRLSMSRPRPTKKVPGTIFSGEDLLEQGIEEEESGDRWLEADLAKSLRFYQRAYELYIEAQSKPVDNNSTKLDILYNTCRLLYHVYNQFCETEGVDIENLNGIEDVINVGDSVIKPLEYIVEVHEQTLVYAEELGHTSLDLLYNLGLVYTQLMEDHPILENETPINDGKLLRLGVRGKHIFTKLLEHQMNSLSTFVQELGSMNQNNDIGGELQATSEQVLQPSEVFETILSCYRQIQAFLENITKYQDIDSFQQFINPFLDTITTVSSQLIADYTVENNRMAEYLDSINEEQLSQQKICYTYIQGLITNDLDEIISLWENPNVPNVPEKYMVFTDNIQEYLDRNDISLATCNTTKDQQMIDIFWRCLTLMTNNLKLAIDQLNVKKSQISEGKGTLISMISNLMIQRSDIDLQRCQLHHPQGIENSNLLLQNAKVFLKNAMNLANSSGGLREKISEKALRIHRKCQSVFRMCVLENKTSVEELDRILGVNVWRKYLVEVNKLDYFVEFTSKVES